MTTSSVSFGGRSWSGLRTYDHSHRDHTKRENDFSNYRLLRAFSSHTMCLVQDGITAELCLE